MALFDRIDPAWPQDVRDRLEDLNRTHEHLDNLAREIQRRAPADIHRNLIKQALKSSTGRQRVTWLRKAADHVNRVALPMTACAAGCSSCCNIGVSVLEPEAQVIGREIGRTPSSPVEGKFVIVDPEGDVNSAASQAAALGAEFNGQPCTFLGADGTCTIYASRPLACRVQINLDTDDLLCRVVPGGAVPVPYLSSMSTKLAYMLAFGRGHKMADLRYFFPN